MSKATHFMGEYDPRGIGHFMPWVKVVETPPDTLIYPIGFTFAQLFEFEWATRSLTVTYSGTTSIAGGFTSVASAHNSYQGDHELTGQTESIYPELTINDERDLLRRAGFYTKIGHGVTPADPPVGYLGGGLEAKIAVQNGASGLGDLGASFWGPNGPPEVVGIQEEQIFPGDAVSGTRILYCTETGLFYPMLFIQVIVAEGPGTGTGGSETATQAIHATGNLLTGLGFGMHASGFQVKIFGSAANYPTPLLIPLQTTGILYGTDGSGGHSFSAELTSDIRIDLVPWDYLA